MICLTSLLDLRHGCDRRPNGPDRLVLTSLLPPKFFADLRCPPVPTAIKATTAKVHHSEGLNSRQGTISGLWLLQTS